MSYREFLDTRRFGSLDGLRALSIFAVLWHHSGLPQSVPLLQRGQVGVQLFFAISGFLITSLMIRERRATGTISMSGFYLRRSLRIFPLYYAVLGVYTALVLATDQGAAGQAFLENLPAFATYTSNWFVPFTTDARVIFYFAWSLATEEQFYLTWPWVERYASPRVRRALLAVLVAAMGATHFGLLAGVIAPESFAHIVLWSIAPPIVFGVIGAHLLHTPNGFAVLGRLFGSRAAAPSLAVLLLAELCLPRGGMALEYALYLTLAALVSACVIREDNGLASLLTLPPLVRVGVVSYGIYLMHMLAFNAAHLIGPKLGVTSAAILWIAGVVAVYVAAEASFRTFERFFQ
ncbi:acyltransferase, partial [bacterium]